MTTNRPIEIPRSLVNQILHYAQHSPEREVCGLVGAKHGVPMTCYPVANAATQPECRFLLDPREQIEAMRRMRDCDEELFAIFHSHPSSAAEPSAIDLEQTTYPQALLLIVSLGTSGVLELRAFRLTTQQTFSEVPLQLQAPG